MTTKRERCKYKYANGRSAYFSLAILKNWVLRQSLGTRLPNSCPFFCSPFSGEDLGSFLYIFDCFPDRKVAREISTYSRADIWSRMDIRQYVDSNRCTSPWSFFIRILNTMKFIILITELIHLLDKRITQSRTFLEYRLGELIRKKKKLKPREMGNLMICYCPLFALRMKLPLSRWRSVCEIEFNFLVSIVKTSKNGNCYDDRHSSNSS